MLFLTFTGTGKSYFFVSKKKVLSNESKNRHVQLSNRFGTGLNKIRETFQSTGITLLNDCDDYSARRIN
jgi:guanylate kinase